MSKSYGNTISIDETPNEMYGKLMSISDDLMWKYYKLLSGLEAESIRSKMLLHPMQAKHDLAYMIASSYHGEIKALAAKEAFTARFSDRSTEIELPYYVLTPEQLMLSWPQLLRELGLVSTASEALRLIKQGGIRLDDVKLEEGAIHLTGEHILRIGKRVLVRIRAS